MSIELGKFNQLEVVKEVDFGVYLDGGEEGEILLPTRYVPEDCKIGDFLNVFLYLDMDERLIATTLTPLVQVGQFACLEVSWVNQYGAFLNWGLMKDLFVPFSEQKMKMQVGRKYVVHAHLDEESYRIVASAKVERYLSKEKPEYTPEAEVNILIWQKTDLGFKAIIDNKYSGLLYENEIFCPLETGMEMKAFVKQVREDGKVDLILQKPGFEKIDDFSKTLLDYIKAHGGRINLNDKSPAEAINEQITAEMWSANLYLAMSFYFEKEGFSGFAHWMKKQSQEEMGHAYAMADYIIKRGGTAKVDKIDVVPNGWGTPLEVFEHVYKHECHVSQLVDKLVDVAAAEKDKATQDFLWGFVREQVEEEATAQGIVDKIKKAGDTGIFFVDSQLGQR